MLFRSHQHPHMQRRGKIQRGVASSKSRQYDSGSSRRGPFRKSALKGKGKSSKILATAHWMVDDFRLTDKCKKLGSSDILAV